MFLYYAERMSNLEIENLQSTPVQIRLSPGVLHISGASRLDLIDRMSTQKVKTLPPGGGAATIFTTDIGRIIDRVLLYADETAVTALTGEGYGAALAGYLRSHVFFGDDFHLEERTADTAVLAVYGAPAVSALQNAGLPAAADLPRHHWRRGDLAGTAVTLHRTDPIGGDGWLMLLPAEQVDAAAAALAAAGIEPIDAAAYDRLRIAAGQPRFGYDLTRDYIPLEAGLWEDVSFNKGCYIGQEIIARMESRGKLAKQLVRLEGAAPLAAGQTLEAAGKPVGTITSAAGPLALGYVRTTVLAAGDPILAGGIPVTVIDRPAERES